MRFDLEKSLTAAEVINTYSQNELARIFREYGEERYSERISAAIVRKRAERPFSTTKDLADAVLSALPAKAKNEDQHPARRVFQACRIEVNGELDSLAKLLKDTPTILKSGGVACFISFHSLEDRLMKDAMKEWENPCQCPRSFPHCNCGKKPVGKILTRKAITPSPEELQRNSRSRSAKLRAFQKY